jgi:hemolysin activation/secretion protein
LRDLVKAAGLVAAAFPFAAAAQPARAIHLAQLAPGRLAQNATDQPGVVLKLAGLRIVDSAAKVEAKGFDRTGVTTSGVAMLDQPQLRNSLAALLGQPVTIDLLQAASKIITDWYRAHDRPFVDVAFPTGQDITNGVIQGVVTESRAGKIIARNNKWFSSDLLTGEVRLKPGDPISLSKLEADRDWLNLNPFHTLDIVAVKGTEPGTTDIAINTLKEDFPLRGHLTYDDTGTPILGLDRWSLGMDWGNALWQDDLFSYQYSSSLPLWRSFGAANASYDAHSASYVMRLPWQDQFVLTGAYASARPELGPDIGLVGINWQLGARYIKSLPTIASITQQVQLGFDFKSSNSNLLFGGLQISDTTSEVAQFTFAYGAALSDSLGQTSLGNTFVFSPGGLTGHNNDADFQAQQAFARAHYVYDRLTLTRLTGLPQDADWVKALGWFKDISSLTRLEGQIAGNELLPSEQFGLGGVDTIPGYSQRVANGTMGYMVSEMIYSPAFSPARILTGGDIPDQAQVGLFFAQGGVRNKHPAEGTSNLNDLSSVGADLRYVWGRYVNLHVDYGLQLRQAPGINRGGRIDVVLNLSY